MALMPRSWVWFPGNTCTNKMYLKCNVYKRPACVFSFMAYKKFMNFRQTRFSISRQLCMLVKPCNESMNLGPTRKDGLCQHEHQIALNLCMIARMTWYKQVKFEDYGEQFLRFHPIGYLMDFLHLFVHW